MEIIFLFVLSAALWTHAWHLLGFYTNPRALGVVGGSVALILLGVVLLGRDTVLIPGTEGPLSALILGWALYGALLAAVGLWGFDNRTLGFFSAFLGLISLLFVGYYFLGDGLLLDTGTSPTGAANGTVSATSYYLGIYSLMLTVSSALLFFHLAPPFHPMRAATGWFFVVTSLLGAIFAGLALLGLPLAAFDT